MRSCLSSLGAVLACLTAHIAVAAPVEWPVASGGNGHAYEAVSVAGGISWTGAQAAASAAGGHLATVTSAAENAFVFALIDSPLYWNQEPGASNLGPWIGGLQTSDVGGAAANWTWVSGKPWAYTNWAGGEPNNYTGANENYLSYKCGTGCRSAGWNDLPDDISVFGTPVLAYVVEYDSVPVPALDPTGVAAVLLLLVATGMLAAAPGEPA